MPDHNTQKFLELFHLGDEEGLNYFFRLLYPSLVLYGLKITGCKEVSEEIASQAFMKVWESHPQFTSPLSLKAYLYRVVSNASIDFLRQQKQARKRQQLLYATSGKEEKSVLHKMIEVELYHQLYKSLDSLPHRSRRIFQLFYFGDKSLQEIALELGTTVNAVKSQKKRAMQLLREQKGSLVSFICFLVTACL